MRYQLTIPARINLLGNPADGNEGAYAILSTAIELFAGATVEPAQGLVLESLQRFEDRLEIEGHAEFGQEELPIPYNGQMDLLKGAVNRLYRHSAEFRLKFARHGVRMAVWTEVPRQSGLGGSSLLVLLALAGLREVYELDRRVHNDYYLAELAQRVEARELGITCGFADRYVPLFGGIAYLDFRGKLHHKEIGSEPYVTYEPLDAWVDDLPLVAVCTGVERDSGDVHSRMRPRYVAQHDDWISRGGAPPTMVRLMQSAWETAWRGKIALLQRDWQTLGALINENHCLVNEMMTHCGFPDGAGWANNLFIEAALAHGALGAKLTGAGGGGSVFALTRPGQEDEIMTTWLRVAQEAGLASACVYRPRISHRGLQVEVD